jgi:hypothetical protein
VGGNTIHTFTTSGTLSPVTSLSASYLVVAGGGGGGGSLAGGGGAGGLLSGSGITIDPNSTYLVTVGAGGTNGAGGNPGTNGGQGGSSAFSMVSTTAVGGGGGGGYTFPTGQNGTSGGSGGGGAGADVTGGTGGAGTSGQGFAGGNGRGGSPYGGGGGGGNSGAGASAAGSNAGNGGIATANSISGTSTYYAGGGGGGVGYVGGTGVAGLGGGTSTTAQKGGASDGASDNSTGTAANATANTGGGGGGGGGSGSTNNGGNGGSGVVIISYAGATQLMAGGTVTISGGNVIHTFTSSGYLAPLKLVNNSLRFRSSASAYLNRTMTTPTNNLKWTWSAWIKRGTLGTSNQLFDGGDGSSNNFGALSFRTEDTLQFAQINGGSYNVQVYTTAVFRDPAAWYHIVVVYDSPNATSTDRIQIYVNGTRQTALTYATGPFSQNTASKINSAIAHYIAKLDYAGIYFDGYQTEVNFIDGQALTPNSFGTFNSYGVWQPITYGGSYGTNGFYLPFTNNASTTTLGYDFSPQGNNWTTNNISLTAGSTYDSMTDVPTLTSATAANYCVLNPLVAGTSSYISGGNLNASISAANTNVLGTMQLPTSGKFYWEYQITTIASSGAPMGGIASSTTTSPAVFYRAEGTKIVDGTQTSYGATYTTTDTIGVAVDIDGGTVVFYKNNTSQGSITYASAGLFPALRSNAGTDVFNINLGQRPLSYTPPSGFVALNTYNL